MRYLNESATQVRVVKRTHIHNDEPQHVAVLLPGESCEVPGGGTYKVDTWLQDPSEREAAQIIAANGGQIVERMSAEDVVELTPEQKAAADEAARRGADMVRAAEQRQAALGGEQDGVGKAGEPMVPAEPVPATAEQNAQFQADVAAGKVAGLEPVVTETDAQREEQLQAHVDMERDAHAAGVADGTAAQVESNSAAVETTGDALAQDVGRMVSEGAPVAPVDPPELSDEVVAEEAAGGLSPQADLSGEDNREPHEQLGGGGL